MEVVGSPQEPVLYSILVMPDETKKCVCPAVTVIDRKGPPKNILENSILVVRGNSNGRVSIWKLPVQQDKQIDWVLQFSEELPVSKLGSLARLIIVL